MGLRRNKKSPAEGEFLFEIDEEPLEEAVTGLGGVPLLVRAARSLDVGGRVRQQVRIKERERGYDEATYVESFLVLQAVGGECLDDFAVLREDPGLAQMLGYAVPSPEAARKFLYAFHEDEKIAQAQQQLKLGAVSYIPEESAALAGLGRVNQEVVAEIGRRCADQKIATIDLDATVIESWKREAHPTYQGGCGYQPMLALWAEMDLVVADQFRDGNVPALQDPLSVAQRAFQALPETVQERYFRGDAACYEERLVSWLRDEQRPGGPAGFIGFAVSVGMQPVLRQALEAVPEKAWQRYREDPTAVLECAEVEDYSPQESAANRRREPLRWIGIRVRHKQGDLFADTAHKYFAVTSNLWDWEPKRLLQWHRQKAGTVEALHDILKNELAAGVMPCARFGANAAWLRLNVLTYNVLSALKRLALPAELLTARPKRLRFLVFHTPGRLLRHARQLRLRLVRAWRRFGDWLGALRKLPLPATG